jgi:hypothetical protein
MRKCIRSSCLRIQGVMIAAGENGRGGWIRTNASRDQNPLPYRLATPL